MQVVFAAKKYDFDVTGPHPDLIVASLCIDGTPTSLQAKKWDEHIYSFDALSQPGPPELRRLTGTLHQKNNSPCFLPGAGDSRGSSEIAFVSSRGSEQEPQVYIMDITAL
jgi:hypothetical protein